MCKRLLIEDVAQEQIPPSCSKLIARLKARGFLEEVGAGVSSRFQSAYIHVTQRCNLRCLYCYSRTSLRNEQPDPSKDDLLTAVSLLSSLGVKRLMISGGEPFLRDDLPDITKGAKEAGIREVVVLTNGVTARSCMLKQLCDSVDLLGISFDGLDNNSPAYLRGTNRLPTLVATAREAISWGLHTRIIVTLHANNLDDMDGYKHLAKAIGAEVGYSLLTAPVCELGDYLLTDRQLETLGTLMSENTSKMPDSLGAKLTVRSSCGAGTRTLSVAADGTIYPCHMLHLPFLAMGNAFSRETTSTDVCTAATALSTASVEFIDGCMGCSVRYLCGGGCRARSIMSLGDLNKRDPFCVLYKTYYDRLGDALTNCYLEKGIRDAV